MKRKQNLKRQSLRIFTAALACVAIFSGQANAVDNDPITTWTFETSTYGSTTGSTGINPTGVYGADANTGSGTASGFHTSSSTLWAGPAGNGSLHSLSSNNWSVGDYYQFQTSTTGFNSVGLFVDQVGSNTGPATFQVQYSTNGTTFTDFGSPYTLSNPGWSTGTHVDVSTYAFDFTSLQAVQNAANVYFRLVDNSTNSISGATVGTGGTSRVDNVTVVNNFVPPEPPPPPPDPEFPMAGDVVFGQSSSAATTLQLVSGNLVPNGGSYTPGPWSTTSSIQAVKFDNYGGVAHNVNGNLLGVRFATGGTGQIYSMGTHGSMPAPDGELIGNTGATGPVGQDGSLSAVSLVGLSVSPNNQKIAVYGQRSDVAATTEVDERLSSVIVYDYTPGNTLGTGASLSGGRELILASSTSEPAPAIGGQTQGTAWLDNSTFLTFSPWGVLSAVHDDGAALTTEVLTSVTTPALIGSDYASIAYNPDVSSKYVFAMYSGFATPDSTSKLYIFDADNNFSLVNEVDLSGSLGQATAREMALDADGNLFIGGFGGVISYVEDAVGLAATLADDTSHTWFDSTLNSSFNGLDVGFGGAAPGLPGDYNGDGVVSNADYNLWKSQFGTAGSLQNETATLGVVDAADYTAWRDHQTSALPGGGSLSAVPEPTSLVLLMLGLTGMVIGRRASQR